MLIFTRLLFDRRDQERLLNALCVLKILRP